MKSSMRMSSYCSRTALLIFTSLACVSIAAQARTLSSELQSWHSRFSTSAVIADYGRSKKNPPPPPRSAPPTKQVTNSNDNSLHIDEGQLNPSSSSSSWYEGKIKKRSPPPPPASSTSPKHSDNTIASPCADDQNPCSSFIEMVIGDGADGEYGTAKRSPPPRPKSPPKTNYSDLMRTINENKFISHLLSTFIN